MRIRIFRACEDPEHPGAPAICAAAPADAGRPRDRGLGALRRRQQYGMIAMYHAANAAIAKAAAHGISVIGVSDSWMSGRSAYFVEMIARAGLVAIHTASSGAAVAPHGGSQPVLGTNPIAFALPGADGPLVLDMGTSAFMGTDLALRVRLGTPLPEGVAIDLDGNPTRDAKAARDGALLPFGGHKGFRLGLIVAAFGLLGGGALR